MTTTIAIHDLIHEYAVLTSAVAETQKRLFEIERQITDSMIAEGATRIPHEHYDVALKPGPKVYDPDKVRATLGEKLPPADIDALAPTQPVECRTCAGLGVTAPKVNGTVANKVRRYGDEYAELLDRCVITQGDPRLEIKPKKAVTA